ncbi:gluconokinase [Bellilinea sp.]|jgi:gluconokinase
MTIQFFLLMGVAGCGKTTVGRALAERLGWAFYDADDYHPAENVAKMAAGIPLTDEDRAGWLERLHALILECLRNDRPAVLACSALKEQYRRVLLAEAEGVQLVYLRAGYDVCRQRLAERRGHYMPVSLLASQFEALEEPAEALVMDASLGVDEIVGQILTGAAGSNSLLERGGKIEPG